MAQSFDETRTQIETEARRALPAEESQFRWITIGVSSLAAVGAGLFIWLFNDSVYQTKTEIGKLLGESKQAMLDTIDSKVIEYRILEELKKRVAHIGRRFPKVVRRGGAYSPTQRAAQ